MSISAVPTSGAPLRPLNPLHRSVKQPTQVQGPPPGVKTASVPRAAVGAAPAQGSLLDTIEQSGAALQASTQSFSESARGLAGHVRDATDPDFDGEASEFGEGGDVTDAALDIIAAKAAVNANIAIFRTADDMLGTLLNIHA